MTDFKIKNIVDVDEILKMKAHMRFINTKAFDQIIWMRNGRVVEISENKIEDFKLTGLNNTDFVEFLNEERVND